MEKPICFAAPFTSSVSVQNSTPPSVARSRLAYRLFHQTASRSMVRKQSGFTLIEILMVLTLLSVVSAAVGGSLVHGSKLYSRFSRALDGQDAALFYERLTHDLKNYVPFSGFPISFASDGMTIVTTNMIKNDDLNASPDYPLMVEYRYLPEKHIIARAVSEYPYKDRREETVLLGVDDASFEWKLVADNRPSHLNIAIKRAGTGDIVPIRHMIGIPTGYDVATE